jgi:hypothetical protein
MGWWPRFVNAEHRSLTTTSVPLRPARIRLVIRMFKSNVLAYMVCQSGSDLESKGEGVTRGTVREQPMERHPYRIGQGCGKTLTLQD